MTWTPRHRCSLGETRFVPALLEHRCVSVGVGRRVHHTDRCCLVNARCVFQVKIKLLTEFHETALVDRAWKLEGVGQGDERVLLERFSSVTAVFQSLSQGSQEVGVCCWPVCYFFSTELLLLRLCHHASDPASRQTQDLEIFDCV